MMGGGVSGFAPSGGISTQQPDVAENHKYRVRLIKNKLINLQIMKKKLPHELFTEEEIDKEIIETRRDLVKFISVVGVNYLDEEVE